MQPIMSDAELPGRRSGANSLKLPACVIGGKRCFLATSVLASSDELIDLAGVGPNQFHDFFVVGSLCNSDTIVDLLDLDLNSFAVLEDRREKGIPLSDVTALFQNRGHLLDMLAERLQQLWIAGGGHSLNAVGEFLHNPLQLIMVGDEKMGVLHLGATAALVPRALGFLVSASAAVPLAALAFGAGAMVALASTIHAFLVSSGVRV